MIYRTKTYLAGDWTDDADLIYKLYELNWSNYWNLHFVDAHELTQSRDTSKPCSIKRSLSERLNASKTFILIVGENTINLTKGCCRYCDSYLPIFPACLSGNTISNKSFIEFECDKAVRDGLRIIVIYNFTRVYKEKCPEILRSVGEHINAYYKTTDGRKCLNYSKIKELINM